MNQQEAIRGIIQIQEYLIRQRCKFSDFDYNAVLNYTREVLLDRSNKSLQVVDSCSFCGSTILTLISYEFKVRGKKISFKSHERNCCKKAIMKARENNFKEAIGLYKDSVGLPSAKLIRSVRQRCRISQEEMGIILGLHPVTLYKYEAGLFWQPILDEHMRRAVIPEELKKMISRNKNLSEERRQELLSRFD